MAAERTIDLETFEKSINYVARLAQPFLSDELTTVILDEAPEIQHKVSKAMLCQASPYFEKALNGGFAEAKSNTLKLPGCDQDTFELFIGYLIAHRLPDYESVLESMAGDNGLQAVRKSATAQKNLIKIWSFAEAHILPRLQNKAMQGLIGVFEYRSMTSDAPKLVYENTATDSPLRKVVVDELVGEWMSDEDPETFDRVWFGNMGRIDGFLYDFTWQLHACTNKVCDHGGECQPSGLDDQSRYMVPEN